MNLKMTITCLIENQSGLYTGQYQLFTDSLYPSILDVGMSNKKPQYRNMRLRYDL